MKRVFVQRLAVVAIVIFGLIGLAVSTPTVSHADEVKQIILIMNASRTKAKEFGDADPSMTTIKNIFLKKTDKWKTGGKFYVVNQKGNDEYTIFRKRVLDKTEAQLATYWSDKDNEDGTQPPKAVKSGKDVFKYVSKKKDAIGYMSKADYSNLSDDEKKKITYIMAISKGN